MKTEQQIKDMRAEMYNTSIKLKQSGVDKYELHQLMLLMVRMMDWVIDDEDKLKGADAIIQLFDKFEKVDSKKLAIF